MYLLLAFSWAPVLEVNDDLRGHEALQCTYGNQPAVVFACQESCSSLSATQASSGFSEVLKKDVWLITVPQLP